MPSWTCACAAQRGAVLGGLGQGSGAGSGVGSSVAVRVLRLAPVVMACKIRCGGCIRRLLPPRASVNRQAHAQGAGAYTPLRRKAILGLPPPLQHLCHHDMAHGQGNMQVWWVALDVRCIVAQQLCGGLVDRATRLVQNAARHACSQAQRDPGFGHAGPPLLYTTSARLTGCLAIAGLGLWCRLGGCWRRHLGQVLHGQVKP